MISPSKPDSASLLSHFNFPSSHLHLVLFIMCISTGCFLHIYLLLCALSPLLGYKTKPWLFATPPPALSTCGSLVGTQILCLHVYLAQSVFLRRGWPVSVRWNEQTQAGMYLGTIGQKVEIKAQSFLKGQVEHGVHVYVAYACKRTFPL